MDRLGNAARLVTVEIIRLAGVDLAEVTAAGALLAADQERCFPVLPGSKILGHAASWRTVCSPSLFTIELSLVYSGPILAVVRIHFALRSIGVS